MPSSSIYETIRIVRENLKETFSEIDTWFDKPEALRTLRLSEGKWSINEILEHLSLTNYYLLLLIRKGAEKALKRAEKADLKTAAESDLKKLDQIATDQAMTWQRPDHMAPGGKKPIAEVRELLREQGQECLQILSRLENGEGVFYAIRMSVADLGKLDVYQWLYFLAQHGRRHLRQIRKIEGKWLSREK